MVKSIIKRIIVGVGIALCLMAIKDGGLIGTVQAMQVYNLTSDQVQYGLTGSTSVVTPTITTHTISGVPHTVFTGATLSSQTDVSWFKYRFANTSLPYTSSRFNMSFVLLHSNFQSQHDPPLTVFLVNSKNDHYACSIDSGSNDRSGSDTATNHTMSYSSTVLCQDVGLATGNFYVLVTGDVVVSSPYKFGISQLSVWNINDSQATIDAINENTQATEDVNNSLNDQSDANTGGFLEDVEQDYSNNPVSDLITMPITFLQRLNNNISGSCITWNLGSLLGTNLTMPCINLQQILGSTLYNLIDMAICLFLAYNLGLMCVTIWNNMTSLKDDFDDMYSPRHAYNGKHTGGGS